MAKRVLSISRLRSPAGSVKACAQVLDAERGEIVGRQRLQRELRGPARHGEPPLRPVALQRDVGALGQLAHDVVQHVRRHGGRAFALGGRRHGLDDLHVEIGRGQRELVIADREQHVGEDRDGVAPLHHARDMGQRAREARFVDAEPHGSPIPDFGASSYARGRGLAQPRARPDPPESMLKARNSLPRPCREGRQNSSAEERPKTGGGTPHRKPPSRLPSYSVHDPSEPVPRVPGSCTSRAAGASEARSPRGAGCRRS